MSAAFSVSWKRGFHARKHSDGREKFSRRSDRFRRLRIRPAGRSQRVLLRLRAGSPGLSGGASQRQLATTTSSEFLTEVDFVEKR